MSIYIEGMEMPRTCYDCKFRKRNGLELVCPVLEKSYKIADTQVLFVREKDCPLIEVPEPHGRLIDADALLRYWEGLAYSGGDCELYSCMADIRDAQTIIPASKEAE